MKTGQVVTSIVEELTCISCRGYIFDLDGNRLACKAWGGAKCRGRQLALTEVDRCPLYHPDTVERCTLKEGHSVLHRTTKGSEWYSTPGAEAAAKVQCMARYHVPLGDVERCTMNTGHEGEHRAGPYSWPEAGKAWRPETKSPVDEAAEAAAKCHGDGPGTFKPEPAGPGTDAYALTYAAGYLRDRLEAAHGREVNLSNQLTAALATRDKANERAMMLGRKLDEVSEELKRTQDTLDKILSRD
jgi:hypothetical protein